MKGREKVKNFSNYTDYDKKENLQMESKCVHGALGCEPLTSYKVMSKMLAQGPHSETTALGVLVIAAAEALPVFL